MSGGGGPSQSSPAIFFGGDCQSPAPMNSMSVTGRSGLGPSSGKMNCGVLNSALNSSAPSLAASSLVTDANSALSGGPQLQRSASINTESYVCPPASPMSFSDGSTVVQQSPHQEQMKKHGASSASSEPTKQEPSSLLHVQKKPRLDTSQDDILQQQVIQKLLQRQESLQLQGHQNPQLQAIIHQQRLAQLQQQQQQQILQSFPQMQRNQINLQQQQLRHHLTQQPVQLVPPVKRPSDGICARRLMQYIYHQRHRPHDNSINYWKKFVAEYFSPQAKQRWCLSSYDNVGNHALGTFPQAAMDAWRCDICGCKSGKGFESTFEVLPRLCQIKFDCGVVDELLFLDMPHESRLSSGIMVLEYTKAIQETVYEQLRVVRDGQLRIIFTPDLKIHSWEFCARRHEEFLPRRLVAPQVNQLLQVVQKYQTAVIESGSAGVSPQNLQTICNMFVAACRHLARNLESPSLNDLGFPKRYVRSLQVSEVVNSMKDLIDFSLEHKEGPIESLKSYPQQAAAKLQSQKMHEMEQVLTSQCPPADQNTLNRIMAIHPGMNTHINSGNTGTRLLNDTTQSAAALNTYHYLLRNPLNSNQNSLQLAASRTFGGPNQTQPLPLPSPNSSTLTNSTINDLSGSNNNHLQQPPMNGNLLQQRNLQSSQVNPNLHAYQQRLKEMMNNNRGSPQQSRSATNVNGNVVTEEVLGGGGSGTEGLQCRMSAGSVQNGIVLGNGTTNMSNNTMGTMPSRSNSIKYSTGGNNFSSNLDMPQNLHLAELDLSEWDI